MKKHVLWPLVRWAFANAVLPILVPFLILVLGDWLFGVLQDPMLAFWKLLFEGFYIFSAMTLFFSLFEDLRHSTNQHRQQRC